ncbi:autotransporter assembly complex protein TamA [Falsiroseomonas oryziterrae]|uniref:autotransporter assembly complex protein TamA n=1 Tax=Falsiroseomonas oryziterrae TaxID=2911368 RepID=UPI001F39A028|nr:autotransporter assembly complex family protein [Roseomonas sp. NPKOSM-4]
MTVIRLLILLLLLSLPAAAQETVLRYATTLRPTGEAALDRALEEASQLRALAEPAPVDAFGLVARAEAEPRRLAQVLQSEGYWASRIEVLIDGQPADTPGLAERLTETRAAEVPVELRITPGPRYVLRHIDLRPASPEDATSLAGIEPAGLAAGEPARADPVLDAEEALVDGLRRAGYPLAAVLDREVVVDHPAQAMDVTWTVAPGPRASFARPAVEGDTRVDPRLLDRVAGRLEGEAYSPQALERARRDLLRLGAFDTVRARPADRLDAAGRLPVTFAVTDRPRNAAGITLAWETEFGPSGRVFYERRNVFGNAETLRLEAEASRLGTGNPGSTEDANWRIGALFRRPALFDGRTTLIAEVFGIRERLKAYDRDAFVASLQFEHPLGERWSVRGGPIFENGRIGRDGNLEPFTLAGLVLAARYDGTDSLLDPRRGIRFDAAATPYADLGEGGGFVRALGTLRTYLDVTGDGGSVVALRGTLGSLIGADRSVPLDKRFYSGGGGSVRGYTFQSIGPRDAQNRPLGGSSLIEGSVELRQRVSGPFGVALFLDAGSVGETETPDLSGVRYGAGLGLRYATAIGPLRVDVGVPLNRESGESSFAVYVGLGQAF